MLGPTIREVIDQLDRIDDAVVSYKAEKADLYLNDITDATEAARTRLIEMEQSLPKPFPTDT